MLNSRQRRRLRRRIRADKTLRTAQNNLIISIGVAAVVVATLIYEVLAYGDGVTVLLGALGTAMATAAVLYAHRQFAATLTAAEQGWTTRLHIQESVVDAFGVDEADMGGLSGDTMATKEDETLALYDTAIRPALDAAQAAAARHAMEDGGLSVQDTQRILRADVVPGHEELISRIIGEVPTDVTSTVRLARPGTTPPDSDTDNHGQ